MIAQMHDMSMLKSGSWKAIVHHEECEDCGGLKAKTKAIFTTKDAKRVKV